MVLGLASVLLLTWLFLWGIFHLAGGPIHLLLAVGLLLLVYRVVTGSKLRQS